MAAVRAGRSRIVCLFALALLLIPSTARAQEFFAYGGRLENTNTHEQDYGWSLAYVEGIGEHAMISFTYLNEGHFSDHHRDGLSPQVWARTNIVNRRLSLAAGVGPYFYLDTASGRADSDSYNTHGWGAIFSLAATWYTQSRWLFQVRGNWVGAVNSFSSLSLSAGVGYQLDSPPSPGPQTAPPHQEERTVNNELTLFVGASTLNRYQSQHSVAEGIEYRRGLTPHIDWTIGFLNEGATFPLERCGIASQLWLVRSVFDSRLALGIGLGPYLAYDEYRGQHGSSTMNALIGLTTSYRFARRWAARLTWDRVVTDHNQDTDILLAGLTCRF